MKIINEYLYKEIIKLFFIVLALVVVIYLAVDFFEKIDNFIENRIGLFEVLTFFILKTPFIIVNVCPIASLLSVIITFSLMNKNNEITALRAGGAGTFYLAAPILLIGIFFSIFLFLFSETVMPYSIKIANDIWYGKIKGRAIETTKDKDIWIKGDSNLINIKYYDPDEQKAFGISVIFFDKKFNMTKRINAEQGIFINDEWLFSNIMEQHLNGLKNKVYFFDKKNYRLSILPSDLLTVIRKPEEMSIKELLSYIKKIEKEGYDADGYKVEFWAKIAFPFTCIIMSLLGCGIPLKRKKKDTIFAYVAYGIGISFLYWIFYSFCLSLGHGEILLPFAAVWIPNFIFSCFTAIILLNAN